MHILHVLDHSIPHQSGYSFRTLAILREQRALGWVTSHVTSSKQGQCGSDFEIVDGWSFHRTAAVNAWAMGGAIHDPLATIFRLRKRLKDLVRQLQPDIIHVHSPVLNGLAALDVAHSLHLPLVYELRALWEDAAVSHGTATEDGLRYRVSRALENYVVRRSDAVVTICDGLRQEIESRGVAENKITVVPNAVDASKFNSGRQPDRSLVEKLKLSGCKVIGFIGSFYEYEGLDVLMRAVPAIVRELPNLKVLLVGGGQHEDGLVQLASELGVSQRIVFAGRVPNGQIAAYYDLIDLLVYPRLRMRLTDLVTPLKPLEAMAQGRILIASDVGGHRELIRDGVNGRLFAAGSPEALAHCAVSLLRDTQAADSIREAARHFVVEERTWARSVSRYAQVYESLLGRSQST